MTGDTMKFVDAGSGAIRMTAGGVSFTFKTDGKAFPTPYGGTVAWKQLDTDTWEVTNKKGETVLSVDTWKLSSDGKTMNIESKGTKPNGESFDDTSVYGRIAGQSGLLGTWKSTEVKMSAPAVFEMKASGTDGMVLSIPDFQATCDAKFDGKDYPATGPTMADAIKKYAARIRSPGLPRSSATASTVEPVASSASTPVVALSAREAAAIAHVIAAMAINQNPSSGNAPWGRATRPLA
jgi:hypothetical protein